jgi:Transposase DDE domain group 1
MRAWRNRERNFLEMQGMASLLQEGMTSPALFRWPDRSRRRYRPTQSSGRAAQMAWSRVSPIGASRTICRPTPPSRAASERDQGRNRQHQPRSRRPQLDKIRRPWPKDKGRGLIERSKRPSSPVRRSLRATHGEQEMSVWNGHYGCICYHPLFLFNQFGDLERCALRPGNVHSADGWEAVLKPVVMRYKSKVSRIYFR